MIPKMDEMTSKEALYEDMVDLGIFDAEPGKIYEDDVAMMQEAMNNGELPQGYTVDEVTDIAERYLQDESLSLDSVNRMKNYINKLKPNTYTIELPVDDDPGEDDPILEEVDDDPEEDDPILEEEEDLHDDYQDKVDEKRGEVVEEDVEAPAGPEEETGVRPFEDITPEETIEFLDEYVEQNFAGQPDALVTEQLKKYLAMNEEGKVFLDTESPLFEFNNPSRILGLSTMPALMGLQSLLEKALPGSSRWLNIGIGALDLTVNTNPFALAVQGVMEMINEINPKPNEMTWKTTRQL